MIISSGRWILHLWSSVSWHLGNFYLRNLTVVLFLLMCTQYQNCALSTRIALLAGYYFRTLLQRASLKPDSSAWPCPTCRKQQQAFLGNNDYSQRALFKHNMADRSSSYLSAYLEFASWLARRLSNFKDLILASLTLPFSMQKRAQGIPASGMQS